MAGNSFGQIFKIHTFGESHGQALGCVIDGCPAGLDFDFEFLSQELKRRRPGQQLTSARHEEDQPEVLSGVFEGKTLGTPIAIIVRNQNAQSEDYKEIKDTARTGHADDMWTKKFGIRDHRGGGRSSGRETVARVMGGAVAKMLLKRLCPELEITGYATQIGSIVLPESDKEKFLAQKNKIKVADSFAARFPSQNLTEKIKSTLEQAKQDGESFGGFCELRVINPPVGLGQPVFHKLKADLASAILGIGATMSVQIGDGMLEQKGTEFHSSISADQYGGVRGGISTGEDLILKIGFKPTSSILDVAKKGRHDPCIIPRAIPVIESMVALVLADHILLQRLDRI